MLTGPSSRAQQLIYQRRAQQTRLSDMRTKLKQQFHQQQFAKWQNKGRNIQIDHQVKQRLAALRQSASVNLQRRRGELAELLEVEARQYKEEILGMQETPEQTRARMAERVKQLKEEKERQRQLQVNTKLQKRFQLNADELRQVDQGIRQQKVAYERSLQLVDKQNTLQEKYEEQMLFAQLNKRDARKKDQIQRLKRQAHQQKVDQRNAILAIQKDLKKRKEDQQRLMSAQEKQMLREEWQRQSELAKLKQLQAIGRQKEVSKTIFVQNEKIRSDKQEQARLQRQVDRQMIQRIVQKERQLAEYEKHMKERQREQAKLIRAGVKNKALEMAAYEKQLDRLIQEERLKKERRQQEEWQKREKGRINLLYQVFEDRARKVDEHKVEKQQDKRTKVQQGEEVARRVREYEQEQQRRRQEELRKGKLSQEQILQQIAAKEERRRELLLEIQREEVQAQRNKLDYDHKIQMRKMQGKQQLQEFKRTNRIF